MLGLVYKVLLLVKVCMDFLFFYIRLDDDIKVLRIINLLIGVKI